MGRIQAERQAVVLRADALEDPRKLLDGGAEHVTAARGVLEREATSPGDETSTARTFSTIRASPVAAPMPRWEPICVFTIVAP